MDPRSYSSWLSQQDQELIAQFCDNGLKKFDFRPHLFAAFVKHKDESDKSVLERNAELVKYRKQFLARRDVLHLLRFNPENDKLPEKKSKLATEFTWEFADEIKQPDELDDEEGEDELSEHNDDAE